MTYYCKCSKISNVLFCLFISRHMIVAGYYGFTLDIHVSVRLSIHISFLDDSLCKHQWIFTELFMCIDIVEISFGIANGQLSSVLEELSARDRPIFSFTDDYLSKCQWIVTKLSICINIKEIWFGIANGQILSIFDSYLPTTR